MLSFDDQSLARLAIAATRVPTSRRRQWLADIAARLEGVPAAVGRSDAARQRRSRRRRNAGLVVMRLEAHEDDTARALILAGRLTEAETARRAWLVH
jgi:hypothetical protein